jgi:hypothetical protein
LNSATAAAPDFFAPAANAARIERTAAGSAVAPPDVAPPQPSAAESAVAASDERRIRFSK